MLGEAQPGLPDTRVEAEMADQLLRAGAALDVADRRHQPGRHGDIHACDREQPPHGRIIDDDHVDVAVEHGKILAEPV